MTLTSARHDWEEGQRRFDAEALDAARGEALYAQRDAVVEELRRRVGSTFTLAELAAAYADSDQWVPEVIEEDSRGGIVVDDYRQMAGKIEEADEMDPYECRAYVEERFSRERMVEDYMDAYRAAIDRAG